MQAPALKPEGFHGRKQAILAWSAQPDPTARRDARGVRRNEAVAELPCRVQGQEAGGLALVLDVLEARHHDPVEVHQLLLTAREAHEIVQVDVGHLQGNVAWGEEELDARPVAQIDERRSDRRKLLMLQAFRMPHAKLSGHQWGKATQSVPNVARRFPGLGC